MIFVRLGEPATPHERGVVYAETLLFLRSLFGVEVRWVQELRAFAVFAPFTARDFLEVAAFRHVAGV